MKNSAHFFLEKVLIFNICIRFDHSGYKRKKIVFVALGREIFTEILTRISYLCRWRLVKLTQDMNEVTLKTLYMIGPGQERCSERGHGKYFIEGRRVNIVKLTEVTTTNSSTEILQQQQHI